MSAKLFLTMPQPGETITEGTIVRWIAKPGDSIKEGQNIVELETEKAVFEYESPFEGTLTQILQPKGAIVPVASPIAIFEIEEKKAKNYLMLGIGKPVNDVGAPLATPIIERTEKRAQQATPLQSETKQKNPTKPSLSPFLRKLVAEHNLSDDDLQKIAGSGPQGRLTKEDVLEYVKNKMSVGALLAGPIFEGAPRGAPTEYKRGDDNLDLIPCEPVRLRIGENMVLSKKTIPHAHTGLEIDLTRLMKHRNQIKAQFEKKHQIPLGLLPLIFPSLIKAIAAYPIVNSVFREQNGKKFIGLYKKINLGVAVDTQRGLHVAVIPDVARMNTVEFAKKLEALLGRARSNAFTVDDLTGMTFTFNNYGFFGTTMGVQVIPPQQATILGMGKIEKKPWVVGNKIEIRDVAQFNMGFDHRVMDGRDTGLFLTALKNSLENFTPLSV